MYVLESLSHYSHIISKTPDPIPNSVHLGTYVCIPKVFYYINLNLNYVTRPHRYGTVRTALQNVGGGGKYVPMNADEKF
jgi:hypothetical protein